MDARQHNKGFLDEDEVDISMLTLWRQICDHVTKHVLSHLFTKLRQRSHVTAFFVCGKWNCRVKLYKKEDS